LETLEIINFFAPLFYYIETENIERRGVRVVEGARLESVYAGNRIAGSNPALSASSSKIII
jgi:hypothetical protein